MSGSALFSVLPHLPHCIVHDLYSEDLLDSHFLLPEEIIQKNKNNTAQNQNKDPFEKLYAVFLE